jgi:hypothetical protein
MGNSSNDLIGRIMKSDIKGREKARAVRIRSSLNFYCYKNETR